MLEVTPEMLAEMRRINDAKFDVENSKRFDKMVRERTAANEAAAAERTARERGVAALQLLRDIIEDASPCTSAGSLLVDKRLIERARELVGE